MEKEGPESVEKEQPVSVEAPECVEKEGPKTVGSPQADGRGVTASDENSPLSLSPQDMVVEKKPPVMEKEAGSERISWPLEERENEWLAEQVIQVVVFTKNLGCFN